MASTYTLISSTTATGSESTITFSSIPQTYTDLVLIASLRTTYPSDYISPNINFNGLSTNLYSQTQVLGYDGSLQTSQRRGTVTNLQYADSPANNATASTFGSLEIYIPSYTVAQNKPSSTFTAAEYNSASINVIGAAANLWRNTAAITSIGISIPNYVFVSGSSFYLYGIKNS